MKKLLLLFALLVHLTGLSWGDVLSEWWREHAGFSRWSDLSLELGENIRVRVSPSQKETLKPGGDEEKRFRLWQWLVLMESVSQEREQDKASLVALGSNAQLLGALLENLHAEDHPRQAIEILSSMQKKYPEDLSALPRLAVALALVLDEPFPENWPHGQVPTKAVPREEPLPVERLHSMAELQKDRRYLLDLRDLMVDELKYLVDHPLTESELEWARKNVTASRSGFDKVFSGIRYDIPRYERNVLTWPYPHYTLAEIRQRGGICVDQAYFAAMAGKAKGLPTLFFTGQGDSGGHAWFGYLESPGRWETDCGRYAQENYPVGQAMDPQIWKPISDTELVFLAKNRERSPAFQQARLWTDYARTLGAGEADQWIEAALSIQPEYLPAWNLRATLLAKNQADLGTQREFWQSFVRRFNPYADLKVQGQEKLLELAKLNGDTKEAANLERQILVQNRGKRFDLGIGAAAGQVLEKMQEGNWDAAQTSFRQALREYKGQAGGHLFYGLVVPFVEAAVAEGQVPAAKTALVEARRVLKPSPDTLVGRSFVLLEGKVNEGGRGN